MVSRKVVMVPPLAEGDEVSRMRRGHMDEDGERSGPVATEAWA